MFHPRELVVLTVLDPFLFYHLNTYVFDILSSFLLKCSFSMHWWTSALVDVYHNFFPGVYKCHQIEEFVKT
jgi:hypothetical protein